MQAARERLGLLPPPADHAALLARARRVGGRLRAAGKVRLQLAKLYGPGGLHADASEVIALLVGALERSE